MDNNKKINSWKNMGLLLVILLSGCLFESDENGVTLADIGNATDQTLDSIQGVGPVVEFEGRLWIGNRAAGKEGLYVYDIANDSVLSYAETGLLPPNSMGIAEEEYLIVANSDFTDGSITSVNLNTGAIDKEYKTINNDSRVSISNKKSFLLENNVNAVTGFNNGKITSSNVFFNLNTGDGSNPRHVGWVSDTKAYITRYGSNFILVVNPSEINGGTKDSIDLSTHVGGYGTDSASGVPHMSDVMVYDKHAFVAIQRLKGFAAIYTSQVLVIDTENDSIVKVIDMELKNPFASSVRGKYWYLSCPDFSGETGGVERIDLEQQISAGVVAREVDLDGNAMNFIATSDSEGFAVVGKAWPTNVLQKVTF
jgi:hypothetical protein